MARRLLHCPLHREKPYIRVRNFCNAFVTIQEKGRDRAKQRTRTLGISPPDLKVGASANLATLTQNFEIDQSKSDIADQQSSSIFVARVEKQKTYEVTKPQTIS